MRADLVASNAAGGGYATAWGYLAEALDRRRRAGVAPFTVLCCDNIPADTRPARTALVSFAALKDPGLARWIHTHVAFPSTMVDRITPQTSTSERDFVERTFGVADKWPVVTEPHRQWVIEDSFSNGRPPAALDATRSARTSGWSASNSSVAGFRKYPLPVIVRLTMRVWGSARAARTAASSSRA
nr:hypothetical protein [Mycobacterium alsense]